MSINKKPEITITAKDAYAGQVLKTFTKLLLTADGDIIEPLEYSDLAEYLPSLDSSQVVVDTNISSSITEQTLVFQTGEDKNESLADFIDEYKHQKSNDKSTIAVYDIEIAIERDGGIEQRFVNNAVVKDYSRSGFTAESSIDNFKTTVVFQGEWRSKFNK